MRTKTATPKARARRPRHATSPPAAATPVASREPVTAGRSPARVLAMPTLRAGRLYGHSSPDRMPAGRKTRSKGRMSPS